MNNLINMEELVFPDHEAMAEWLRREHDKGTTHVEELRLPLPEYPPERPDEEKINIIIQL